MNAQVHWIPTRSRQQAAQDATELFRSTYNTDPAGCWVAPGRVNLIGEHVDYAQGISLPFALSQVTAVAASPREDSTVRITSISGESTLQAEVDLNEVGPKNPANWSGYIVGTIWALAEAGVIPLQGYDMALVSDVPLGAGLSSSAALECCVAVAACDLQHATADKDTLATACMRAENEVVGASTGGLDQQISLKGEDGHALAIDFRDNTSYQVPFDMKGHGLAILVVDTNAPHELADGQYASRRAVIDGVSEKFGALREQENLNPDAWADENPDPTGTLDQQAWRQKVRARVAHVQSEITRTANAIEQLKRGDMAAFGDSMCASHASLRDDYEVSCPELNMVVDTAMANGALGARMTGGGFGGSAIALVKEADTEKIAQAIANAFAEANFRDPRVAVAIPAAGAQRVEV